MSVPETEPLRLVENEDTGDRFLIYQTAQGSRLELQFSGDTLWMSQAQMAALFGVDVRTVSEHLTKIYDEGEREQNSTLRNLRIVRTESALAEDSVCAKNAQTAARAQATRPYL